MSAGAFLSDAARACEGPLSAQSSHTQAAPASPSRLTSGARGSSPRSILSNAAEATARASARLIAGYRPMTCQCRLPWRQNRTCLAFDRAQMTRTRPGAASSGTSSCGVPGGRTTDRTDASESLVSMTFQKTAIRFQGPFRGEVARQVQTCCLFGETLGTCKRTLEGPEVTPRDRLALSARPAT
jgi:hypothetical protein